MYVNLYLGPGQVAGQDRWPLNSGTVAFTTGSTAQ